MVRYGCWDLKKELGVQDQDEMKEVVERSVTE
jgi:hypothetical protein